MSSYLTYYAESNLVCLVIFGILLTHDLLNSDRREAQVKYDEALISFMLYFISDIVWAAFIDGALPKSRAAVLAANFANFLIMAMLTYMWLRYVMAVEQAPNRDKPAHRFAVLSPFLLATVALIVTYLVKPELLLDENLNTRPAYDIFQITVPIIYVIAVLIHALSKARKLQNPYERRRLVYIGFLPLLVVCGGLVQVLFMSDTPVFCFACVILMLLFHLQSMQTQISLDPLTGLNNRGQLHRYSAQRANLFMEGRLTYVVMIDVNDFKLINDSYGHAEGDKALILIANALRRAVRSRNMPIFLGRYGGDEFILIAHPTAEQDMEALATAIRLQIINACREQETPYALSVGIGYDEMLGEQDTLIKCMQRADRKLYLDKEYRKMQAKTKA